ncbi:MAG: PorV/PorQ family protein [Calditrichales bacterium]|nr:MAG: PorV/PorQ family protein [Calditrichales bacterium]
MRKSFILSVASLVFIAMQLTPAFSAEKKLAQTGIKFLSVSLDARASGLGGAVTSLEGNSTSLLYNPAGMATMEGFVDVAFGQVSWIADIKQIYGTAAISIEGGRYGVVGISFVTVDYGDFKGTIRADNDQGFVDTGIFSPNAFALGVGYARALSEKFSVGGQIRYVFQDLTGGITDFTSDQMPLISTYDMNVMAYDFGIIYRTGYESLSFGMNIRNFSREVQYIEERFQLPLTFEMGLSMNMFDFLDMDKSQHSMLLSIDAVHPRDYSEQVDVGLEYTFLNMFSLRAGSTFPTDEQGFSFGAGLVQSFGDFGLAIDYAYTDFGVFDAVHRFALKFSL